MCPDDQREESAAGCVAKRSKFPILRPNTLSLPSRFIFEKTFKKSRGLYFLSLRKKYTIGTENIKSALILNAVFIVYNSAK